MSKIIKILLNQNIGVPNIPVVEIGETVKLGQLIAKAEGLGADLHASGSGLVRDITKDFISIESVKAQSGDFVKMEAYENIAEQVKAAGLVGMGGAGFPTYVKLQTKIEGGCIIANAAECEPLLAHNIQQIIENPDRIYKGMKYAMQSTGASKAYLAIKKKQKDAIEAFKKVIDGDNDIKIALLDDLYPMGEERAIIRETLGVLLKTDELPSVAGAVVLNVETLGRITEAVELRKPVTHKNITVVGKKQNEIITKVLMDVAIGTPIRSIIDTCAIDLAGHGEIIVGGPFTGSPAELDDVVTKTTGGILVTMEFMHEKRNMGLLVCACGADETRLRDLADKMGAPVVAVERCKQAVETKGGLKCENPGNCPGQAEKILSLKRQGAEVLMISNCSDCSNTVMCVAPKLKMPVYHCTDHVMRTAGYPLIRRLK